MPSIQKCRVFFACILIIWLSVFVTGCVSLPDPESSQDSSSEIIGTVNPSQTLSQTILIRRNGFNGITLWLDSKGAAPTANDQGGQLLHLYLYTHPEPSTLINHTTIRLDHSQEKQAYSVFFPQQEKSSGKIYTLLLSTDSGEVSIYGRLDNIYPQGQAFINLQPLEADIAFTTTYYYEHNAFFNDLNGWLRNANLIPAFIIVLFLPGWLALRLVPDFSIAELSEKIGISIGISLAIIPIVLLWTSIFGISWTKSTILFSSGFLVSIWVFGIIKGRHIQRILAHGKQGVSRIKGEKSTKGSLYSHNKSTSLLIPLFLLGIFLVSLAVRLSMVRDLATPAWVDSVHHALITRIILETGALPQTYFPYMDLDSVFYHPGFHSQLATFKLLSNLDIPSAMLVFGQVVNALMVVAIFILTKKVTHSDVAAIFAALITGLFTPMPAYYTSWGRYTQLSGLAILPTAYILFTTAINQKTNTAKIIYSLLIAAITTGGLFLVHYRVTAFFIFLIVSEFLTDFLFSKMDKNSIKRRLLLITVFAVLVVLIVIPWLVKAIPDTFIPSLTRTAQAETRWFADFSWRYLSAALGKQALAIGVLGAAWGLIKKKRFAILLLIWIILLLVFANFGMLGLPGGSLINTTSVEISLFIPVSIFGGYFISELIYSWKSILPVKLHLPLFIGIFFSTILVAFIASKNIIPILNPVTFLSRQADLNAIHWVGDHINTDEAILINPFLWGYGLYAGTDGGSWITPLTGLKTIPPPVLYALATEEDRERINQISQFVIDNGSNAEELHGYLIDNNIHYIFIGARGGPITPQSLLKHPGFRSIYEYQGVRVIEILP